MYLVAIGWMYVVVMMAAAEATSPQGTLLGAIITFVFYGLLPVSIVIYILGTPARRRARLKAEAVERETPLAASEPAHLADEAAEGSADKTTEAASAVAAEASTAPPDGSGHPAGGAIAPEGEKV